jgi:hypothetical protein
VLEVLEVVAVDALELESEPELDSLEPQPTANASAAQAITTVGSALLMGDPFSARCTQPNGRPRPVMPRGGSRCRSA